MQLLAFKGKEIIRYYEGLLLCNGSAFLKAFFASKSSSPSSVLDSYTFDWFIFWHSDQVERDVTDLMLKALKYCDSSSTNDVMRQYRAATMHHRLSSLFHNSYRDHQVILKLLLCYRLWELSSPSLALHKDFNVEYWFVIIICVWNASDLEDYVTSDLPQVEGGFINGRHCGISSCIFTIWNSYASEMVFHGCALLCGPTGPCWHLKYLFGVKFYVVDCGSFIFITLV